MTLFKTLKDVFFGGGVSDREIRAESWALGGRHAGEVVRGARAELADSRLSPRRALLLRAVIRSQERAAAR